MNLADDNMVMPVSPYGGAGGSDGFGGNWAWIILLLLLGWGNNGWGRGNANDGTAATLYPWMNQADITNSGFQNQFLNDNITEIRNGVTGLSSQLCNSTASIQQNLCSGFANIESNANARQMANMQQAFNSQTAITNGLSNLGSLFSNSCGENRLATCQTQNIIQNEGNATRFANANNTRDIIQSQTTGTQAILDRLCQLELDAKNDKINDLERQLTMANLAASQTAQTSRILADNAAQTVALEQYLNPAPVPAYLVQNPNCCTQSCGCA